MSQAPTGSWEQPYQDACEEAALLMAHRWVTGTSVTRAEANVELLRMIQFQNDVFGDYRDTSAARSAELFRRFYQSEAVRLVPSAALADVKRELAHGNIVLLPMAGRRLNGPYYRSPGPLYHMLLIRGYDEDTKEFVVNDDGTNTKGEAFRFSSAAIERSWNDWDHEANTLAPPRAPKPMIVVSRNTKP